MARSGRAEMASGFNGGRVPAVEAAGLRKAGSPRPAPATFPQTLEIRCGFPQLPPPRRREKPTKEGGKFSCEGRGKFGCELTDARQPAPRRTTRPGSRAAPPSRRARESQAARPLEDLRGETHGRRSHHLPGLSPGDPGRTQRPSDGCARTTALPNRFLMRSPPAHSLPRHAPSAGSGAACVAIQTRPETPGRLHLLSTPPLPMAPHHKPPTRPHPSSRGSQRQTSRKIHAIPSP
jgi:hypothetical protein